MLFRATKQKAKKLKAQYDYVIAGGGSAGCVLANRLSANPDVNVLLLEAGRADGHPYIHMPVGFAKLTGNTHSWGYKTVPQKHLDNREVWYTQARVLGGGSSINAQVYTRGHKLDYDAWETEAGAQGWRYDDVLPYFRRAEQNQRLVDEFHGQDGPLKISDPVPQKLSTAYVRAAQQAGIPFNTDFNGEDQAGIGYYQLTNREGYRSSAPVCYLKPVLGRSNLHVMTGVSVLNIEFDGTRATGVRVMLPNGMVQSIHAGAEVIVTAGAIGSPKLLQLSGIGDADELRKLGIDPVAHLPGVGENLQDHMDVFAVGECSDDYSADKYKMPHHAAWAGLQYALFKSGPVASNLCDAGGFWYADKDARSPDIQFHFLPGSGLEHGLKPLRNGITLNSAFLRPLSRGTVKLSDSNPNSAPLIDPNYWADPYDRKMSIEGFKIAREILHQDAFKPYIKAEADPGKHVKTDNEIAEYAKQFCKTDYHPVGTCKMGDANDETAVVTSDLKVKGVDGLRVIDSSVMPLLVSSNTNAPTIMVAEKGADHVLGVA